MSSLRLESQLFRKGYQMIAGVDEAGRGAWAGPIVAAAVILPPGLKIKGVKDSKLLTPEAREELYQEIIERAISWSMAKISSKIIDKVGLSKANIVALRQAFLKLHPRPDYLLIDAYSLGYLDISYQAIIRGDRLIHSIAAASIIAKVTRDRLMIKEDKKFPVYHFARHKGYGTKLHYEKISEFGFSPIHRRSFRLPLEYQREK